MWKFYRKKVLQEMRPYVVGEDVTGISISVEDRLEGNPKLGGMIARNSDKHDDQWYIAEEFFSDNYKQVSNL